MTQPVPPYNYDTIEWYKALAENLVRQADAAGVIVTIRQESIFPPAMRHYVTVVEVRKKQ